MIMLMKRYNVKQQKPNHLITVRLGSNQNTLNHEAHE